MLRNISVPKKYTFGWISFWVRLHYYHLAHNTWTDLRGADHIAFRESIRPPGEVHHIIMLPSFESTAANPRT